VHLLRNGTLFSKQISEELDEIWVSHDEEYKNIVRVWLTNLPNPHWNRMLNISLTTKSWNSMRSWSLLSVRKSCVFWKETVQQDEWGRKWKATEIVGCEGSLRWRGRKEGRIVFECFADYSLQPKDFSGRRLRKRQGPVNPWYSSQSKTHLEWRNISGFQTPFPSLCLINTLQFSVKLFTEVVSDYQKTQEKSRNLIRFPVWKTFQK
jgi:hypothetical protein